MSAQPWNDGQRRKGFGSILYYGGEYWGGPDPQREDMLARASVASTARLVRSVVEGTPLGLMSDQDGGTWGAARFAGGSDKSMFAAAADLPELAALPDARAAFLEASKAPRTIDAPGARLWWYRLSRQPWFQAFYWGRWFARVLHPAYARALALGWRSELGVATLARTRNSSPAAMERAISAARRAGGSEAAQVEAALAQYASERPLYAERAAELRRRHPMTPLHRRPEPSDLWLDAPARRPDGSPVPPEPAPRGRLAILATLATVALAVAGAFLWRS